MRAFSLMYHDVVAPGGEEQSGFPGAWPAFYKVTEAQFRDHLTRIRAALGNRTVGLVEAAGWSSAPVFLTFDDGGVSFLTAAGLLEEFGMRGHFFITTGRIGTPGFLTPPHLRNLRKRGHAIGSHSVNHPTRMQDLSRRELAAEWSQSLSTLADLLGEPIPTASVPGGYYSRAVGETAAEAGIRYLFTSEPSAKVDKLNGCLVLGRYAINRDTSAPGAAALASGCFLPRFQQAAWWSLKKVVKNTAGPVYLRAASLLRGR